MLYASAENWTWKELLGRIDSDGVKEITEYLKGLLVEVTEEYNVEKDNLMPFPWFQPWKYDPKGKVLTAEEFKAKVGSKLNDMLDAMKIVWNS